MLGKKILIYHVGSLGDILVAVPAFWILRSFFPNARITLLTSIVKNKNYVMAKDILDGSGLIDGYIYYSYDSSKLGKLLKWFELLKLSCQLHSKKFDSLVYLIRAYAGEARIIRDLIFFRMIGIQNIIGDKGFFELPEKKIGEPLPEIRHQSDQLLTRLALSGVPVPQPGCGRTDINIGDKEKRAVDSWLKVLPSDGGRRWVGVGIGGKKPVSRWPIENYQQLIQLLINKYDIWPVIFGGPENESEANRLITFWKKGYFNSGLSIRESIAALSRCILFLGNDSGTMHMATSAGVPRLGIYPSENYPGEWYPYGENKLVIRTPISCEGCRHENCYENKKKCLLSITIEDVIIQAGDFIAKHLS